MTDHLYRKLQHKIKLHIYFYMYFMETCMDVNALKRLEAITVSVSQEVKWGPVLESPLVKVRSINF